MKKNIQFLFYIYIVLCLGGCVLRDAKEVQSQVMVVSLKDNYSSLYEYALAWDDSAYLENASIPIELDGISYIQIMAHFQSPEKRNESIIVELIGDGNINVNYVEHNNEVVQSEAIDIFDLGIDSSQVLPIIIKNEPKLKLSPSSIISLKLEYIIFDNEKHIVWRLCTDMQSHDAKIYYVDAKSGELINLSD